MVFPLLAFLMFTFVLAQNVVRASRSFADKAVLLIAERYCSNLIFCLFQVVFKCHARLWWRLPVILDMERVWLAITISEEKFQMDISGDIVKVFNQSRLLCGAALGV